jgi:cysteine-rich repeat protein
VKKNRLLSLLIIVGLGVALGLLFVTPALAETLTANQMFGGDSETFAASSGLASGSLVLMIARAIRTFLGFLGIVAVIVVLYAGFLWVTAGGEEEKIAKAKKVLKNGLIGLLIMLSSFTIAQFVLSRLTSSIGGGVGTEVGGGGGGGDIPDYAHSFVLTSVNTDCASSLQNLELRFIFSQRVATEDVVDGTGISISKGGEEVAGTFAAVGRSTTASATSFTFTPEAICFAEDDYSVNCFEAETTYNITISSALQSSSGYDLQCSTAYPCEFTFTTGTGFDLAAPTVFEITAPDDGESVYADEAAMLQAYAVDDTGVASVDFYIDTGINSTVNDIEGDGYFDSEWDTAGYFTNDDHSILAEGSDCAGNDVDAEISVMLRAASCHNGVQDESESGIDCGGSSSADSYCGACENQECTDSSDCSSGSCVDGVCEEEVEIEAVSPGDGAPGNLITISGQGFGEAPGSVVFLGTTTEVSHSAYSSEECVEAWSDSQVIIQLKDEAESGPIKLIAADGKYDQTNDENGSYISDFEVNETVRPGLCSIDPESGEAGSAVTLHGINLGESSTDATLYFDSYEAASYSDWSTTSFGAVSPLLDAGIFDIQLFTGSGDAREGSNELQFVTTSVTEEELPVISQVDPEEGPIGQYLTIYGSGFGTSEGTVRFVSQSTDYEALGDTNFPDECEDSFWSDTEIIIKVPAKYSNTNSVDAITHDLYIQRAEDGLKSEAVNFVVTTGEAAPGFCAIVPNSGPVGTAVTLYGEGFGTTVGSISFFNDQTATTDDWTSGAIGETTGVVVPADTNSGPVIVIDSDAQKSNKVNFTVGVCNVDFSCGSGETCCASGACSATECVDPETVSHYAYYFSTGDIPEAPDVRIECDETWVSPTPWEGWDGGTKICSNAALSVSFTEDMDALSYSTAGFLVEQCTDKTCSDTAAVEMESSPTSYNESGFTWIPASDWAADTRYRVTVYGGEVGTIQSIEGLVMLEDVIWEFETAASGDACEIGGVIVSPGEKTSNIQNEEIAYSAAPTSSEYQCTVLDCSPYTWNFSSSDSSKASVGSVVGCGAMVIAEEETGTDGPVAINAQPDGYSVSDDGYLTISFTDPKITDYWPSCTEACLDAEIGATFNIPMAAGTFSGTDSGGEQIVRLFSCEDPGCAPDELVEISSVASSYDDETDILTIVPPGNLLIDTSYRVIISGEAESESGSLLSEAAGDLAWYGDLSWTFTTKAEACTVDRVEVEPNEATATRVGTIQRFTAVPYGSPDACSAEGQRLIAAGYTWETWVAIDETDELPTANIADLVGGGAIMISNNLADGCSLDCLHIGTETPIAVCGDGEIDFGEDCDGTEGCSSSCLRLGSGGSYSTPSVCGDGAVGIGEECDELGNTSNNDGCSSICLNEGASSLGYDCGDGLVAHSNMIGGEECDYGEDKAAYNCSANCLNEGSETIDNFYGVCGNGSDPEHGEDCDDGNTTDGDGCSSSCLNEGSSSSYSIPSACGDGEIGTGEDCDDGNTTDDDGCSSLCLSEGSDEDYGSICGDLDLETEAGEECEASGVTSVAPFTIAEISEEAPQEVLASGENIAITSIVATEGSSEAEGSATFTLECSCVSDYNCDTSGITYGCGDAACCFKRPAITDYYPVAGSTGVCRNTSVYMDFDQTMDAGGLNDSRALYLEFVSIGTGPTAIAVDETNCPTTYTTLLIARNDSGDNLFSRAWGWLAQNVLRILGVHAETFGACLVPVSYTLSELGDGSRIDLDFSQALESGTYNLVALGESAGDPLDNIVEGVVNTNGVAIYDGEIVNFEVGTEICALEMVSVEDTGKTELKDIFDEPSAYLFTESGEEHTLLAASYTLDGASAEEIQEIDDYSWTWGWGDESAETVIEVINVDDVTTTVTSSGVNGEELASASATVVSDGTIVTGSAELEANMCETLWPNPMTAAFPYLEDYSNFSFYYCRDQEGSDNLPELIEVEPPVTPSGVDILQERLFLIDGTSDAIGVRVFSNEDYLSPSAWFDVQGFSGSPSETTVDGYEAVQDGNTYYVSAANYSSSSVTNYPNIYVISYNEGAGEETDAIVEQVLENWKFNAGLNSSGDLEVSDINVCVSDGDYAVNAEGDYVSCVSNLDCISELSDASAFCDAEKGKLRRNMVRLTDARKIASDLAAYGEENRHCSVTKGQDCSEDDDCPGDDETCMAEVPEIQSGTFLSAFSTSTWPSWNAELGNALGTAIPTDPLNEFYCPGYTDQTYCWDSTAGTFSCSEDSNTYLYQSIGGEEYILSVQLEDSPGDYWAYPIDDDSTDNATVYAEFANAEDVANGFRIDSEFCNGSNLGTSTRCGDGVRGLSEICELGNTDTISCTYDSDDDGIDDNNGTMDAPCLSDCSDYMDESEAEAAGGSCSPYECGNGVLDPGETCDDGTNNGEYGYCDSDCGLDNAWYCGDGYLAGGEECDCGSTANWTDVHADTSSWSTINSCADANGIYDADAAHTCAYDCSYPGPSCGDGEVNSDESCDGNSEAWNGALCGAADNYATCTTDADCDETDCGTVYAACPISAVCDGGDRDNEECSEDADCTGGGDCKTSFEYQLSRYRTCDDGTGGACGWNTWSACLGGTQICGNGSVEGDEECDDGNDDNTDDCTAECKFNICGDDAVYAGHETCDDGLENGTVCSPDYSGTCNYCNVNCQYTTMSGSYCGDGVMQTGEFCDGSDLPKYCYLAGTNPDERGISTSACETDADCDTDNNYHCLEQVGVCNGGWRQASVCGDFICTLDGYYDYNGAPCVAGTGSSGYDCGIDSSGGTCMVADCGATCSATCPFSYSTTSVSIQTELAGATEETSADLYSYNSGDSPDTASIFLPACSVGTSLTADIDTTNIIPLDVDIVFVTDLSGSMSSTKIEATVNSISSAIQELFNAFDDYSNLQIGLVSFTNTLEDGSDHNNDGAITLADACITNSAGTTGLAWIDSDLTTNESQLIYGEYSVESYSTRTGGSTPLSAGLQCAANILEDSEADDQIIILLSDGDPNVLIDSSTYTSAYKYYEEIQDIRNAAIANGIEIYTAALMTTDALIGKMAHWSSDSCLENDPSETAYSNVADCSVTDDIEYAFSASSSDDLDEMYQQIADSIIGLTMTFTTDFAGETTLTSDEVFDGDDVVIPFPEGFGCDTENEWNIPFRISFSGEGTVNISDIKLSYCPASSASVGTGASSTIDSDGDGVLDFNDNCPNDANEDQADANLNEIGDVCEGAAGSVGSVGGGETLADTDGDGIVDVEDNCPSVVNVSQADADSDGIGDACDSGCGDGGIDTADGEYCDGGDFPKYCVNFDEDPSLRDIYALGSDTGCDAGYAENYGNILGICSGGTTGGYDFDSAVCYTSTSWSEAMCGSGADAGVCKANTCDGTCSTDTLSAYLPVCGDSIIDGGESCDETAFEDIYCVRGATNPASRVIKLASSCTDTATCDCSLFGPGYSAMAADDLGICDGGSRRLILPPVLYDYTNRLCVVGSSSASLYCGVTSGVWGTTAGTCVANTCGDDCDSSSIEDMFFP